MLVFGGFLIAFRWIDLSTPLIRLFLLVLILRLMPTLNFLPGWFALSHLPVRHPSRLPMMLLPWLGPRTGVLTPSRTGRLLAPLPVRRRTTLFLVSWTGP